MKKLLEAERRFCCDKILQETQPQPNISRYAASFQQT